MSHAKPIRMKQYKAKQIWTKASLSYRSLLNLKRISNQTAAVMFASDIILCDSWLSEKMYHNFSFFMHVNPEISEKESFTVKSPLIESFLSLFLILYIKKKLILQSNIYQKFTIYIDTLSLTHPRNLLFLLLESILVGKKST